MKNVYLHVAANLEKTNWWAWSFFCCHFHIVILMRTSLCVCHYQSIRQEFQPKTIRLRDPPAFATMIIWRLLHTNTLSEAEVLKLTIHSLYQNKIDLRCHFRKAISQELQNVARLDGFEQPARAPACAERCAQLRTTCRQPHQPAL